LKGTSKRERRTTEFKKKTVRRMLAGEPITRLSRELKVGRSLLYRWRNAYYKEGTAGFRPIGRPGWNLEDQAKGAESRISELERKIGQQAMVIDFLRKAFKRVEELRQPSKGNGGTASMERSRP
jgi:transposase-like protein